MHSDVCRTEVAPLHVRIRTKPHGHLPGLGVQVTSQRCLATSCRRDAALEEQHAVGREVGWGAGTDTWREPICRCLDKFKSPGRAAGRHERVRDPSGGGADESEVAVPLGKDQCAVGRQPAQVGTCQLEAGFIGRTLDRISIFPDGRCYVCSYLFDTDLHFATMQDGKVALNKDANEIPPRGRTPSARPRSWPASPSAPTARCCALPTCPRSRSLGGVGAGCASRSPSARSRAQFTVRESKLTVERYPQPNGAHCASAPLLLPEHHLHKAIRAAIA